MVFDPETLAQYKDADGNFDASHLTDGYTNLSDYRKGMVFQQLPRIMTPGAYADKNIPWDKGALVQAERDARDAAYVPYAVESMPKIAALAEELETIALYETDVKKYFQQTTATWVTNDVDIEAEWAAYVENMNKLGADKILEVKQQQYDRYLTLK